MVQAEVQHRPNFQRAKKVADQLLERFNNPSTPIDVHNIARQLNCRVIYDQLHGAAGYTFRKLINNQWRYVIIIANDMNNVNYSPQQIHYRQRFTLAHELGHILLHNHLNWNTVETPLDDILEVEANWFASRLLMPDYTFNSIADLLPEILTDKCQINYQAAIKRIKKVDIRISSQLIRNALMLENQLRKMEVRT